jgi:hypothetical protein
MTTNEYILFDFDDPDKSGKWYVVNDDVMGGVSQSSFKMDKGIAVFRGTLSPDNNGGFASVRTRLSIETNVAYQGIKIRVKGDGKTYNMRFRNDNNFDGYAYQLKFKTEVDTWIEVEMPFKAFEAIFRGNKLFDKPGLEFDQVRQTGFLIADKQFGEFKLEIDWIKCY